MAGLGVNDQIPELGQTVGEALLTPTRIYARPVRKIMNYYRGRGVLHGIAHITGGGLHGNLERIMPAGLQAVIQRESWKPAPVFHWLQGLGGVDDDEMARVFNMGLGLVLIFNPHYESTIRRILDDHQMESWKIGEVKSGPQGVVWAD
jgi:phosphoribosylformylglycinamidine cyclo-ligase